MNFKRWFIFSAIIFVLAFFIGVITAPNEVPQEILDVFPEEIFNLTPMALFVFLILNNSLTLLVCFTLSPLLLLYPLFSLFFNGWFTGAVAALVLQENSFLDLVAGIVPHGIIEIPAFLIAMAATFSFGTAVIMAVFKKERRVEVVPSFKENIRYLAVAVLLLIPAAAVEAFVTPKVISLFSG